MRGWHKPKVTSVGMGHSTTTRWAQYQRPTFGNTPNEYWPSAPGNGERLSGEKLRRLLLRILPSRVSARGPAKHRWINRWKHGLYERIFANKASSWKWMKYYFCQKQWFWVTSYWHRSFLAVTKWHSTDVAFKTNMSDWLCIDQVVADCEN